MIPAKIIPATRIRDLARDRPELEIQICPAVFYKERKKKKPKKKKTPSGATEIHTTLYLPRFTGKRYVVDVVWEAGGEGLSDFYDDLQTFLLPRVVERAGGNPDPDYFYPFYALYEKPTFDLTSEAHSMLYEASYNMAESLLAEVSNLDLLNEKVLRSDVTHILRSALRDYVAKRKPSKRKKKAK